MQIIYIQGYPNEKTQVEEKIYLRICESIAYTGETRGTETSKYPQEKKENSIPKVAASEIGRAQTEGRNTIGVTDYIIDYQDDLNAVEEAIKEGDNPVEEIKIAR